MKQLYNYLQKTGPNLSWYKAKEICEEVVNKGNTNFTLELVYGYAGNYCVYSVHLITYSYIWQICYISSGCNHQKLEKCDHKKIFRMAAVILFNFSKPLLIKITN